MLSVRRLHIVVIKFSLFWICCLLVFKSVNSFIVPPSSTHDVCHGRCHNDDNNKNKILSFETDRISRRRKTTTNSRLLFNYNIRMILSSQRFLTTQESTISNKQRRQFIWSYHYPFYTSIIKKKQHHQQQSQLYSSSSHHQPEKHNDINNNATQTSFHNTNNDLIVQEYDEMIKLHSDVRIRDCQYNELGKVADIIMSSFYNNEQTASIWNNIYRIAEINRIQQSFPYSDDRELHRMLVATIPRKASTSAKSNDDENIIVGFVDIDIRPATNLNSGLYSYNPRPYLSDLCIDPQYRRIGIAKQLILYCEQFCFNISNEALQRANIKLQSSQNKNTNKKNNVNFTSIKNNQLYIRVEKTNIPAIQMYNQLGYKEIYNPDDPNNIKIIILQKQLVVS